MSLFQEIPCTHGRITRHAMGMPGGGGMEWCDGGTRELFQPDLIDIVFDGPPEHIAGRFVEVENQKGASISVGEWIHRKDGYWVLRMSIVPEEAR